MQIRRLIFAATAATLLASAAFAASTSTKHTPDCGALQSQFDSAIAGKASVAKVAAAKALRAEGGNLCATGQTKAGVSYLESALKIIDVKPQG
jgi:hypothetical protein